MPNRAATLFPIAAALALAACDGVSKETELASLDNQILENGTDPALTSALEDQILVDPALTQQSNKNAVRPAETPVQAQYPARPATVRRASGEHSSGAGEGEGVGCGAEFNHNLQWVRRLPAPFAVLPGARLTDAAGSDAGDCHARVVTFTSSAAPQRVLEWYRNRTTRAGYSAGHEMRQGDHILAGLNAAESSAFYLIVTPLRGGGSDVALIAKQGG